MATIPVRIPDDDAARLAELAAESFRHPREQAAALLVAAIRHATGRRRERLIEAGKVAR